MGWFNIGFLDNADHKDLKAEKPVAAGGAFNPKNALARREADAEGDSGARTADAKPDDKASMSQASFSGYK